MKYSLMTNQIPPFVRDGNVLHRIIATEDFGTVRVGDIGGYIQSFDNLSTEGTCWVDYNAVVCGSAVVKDNAQIRDNALVSGAAKVIHNAVISGSAKVLNNVTVRESSCVKDSATITDSSVIMCNSSISGSSFISGSAKVNESSISGSSKITSSHVMNSSISDNVLVGPGVTLRDSQMIDESSIVGDITGSSFRASGSSKVYGTGSLEFVSITNTASLYVVYNVRKLDITHTPVVMIIDYVKRDSVLIFKDYLYMQNQVHSFSSLNDKEYLSKTGVGFQSWYYKYKESVDAIQRSMLLINYVR